MATNKQEDQKTYKQMAGDYYNRQYESWMPWVEDQYLKWFTKDNKASYATKRTFPLPPYSPSVFFNPRLIYSFLSHRTT